MRIYIKCSESTYCNPEFITIIPHADGDSVDILMYKNTLPWAWIDKMITFGDKDIRFHSEGDFETITIKHSLIYRIGDIPLKQQPL